MQPFDLKRYEKGRQLMKRTSQTFSVEHGLIALGFLKLLLVAVFFASFAWMVPDDAHADEACSGSNLLTKLQTENSDLYAQVRREAETVENADSLFWKVEKPGAPTSYLFGTMHMADPEIATLGDDLKSALDSVDVVVVESTDALDPKKSQAAMGQVAHLTMLKSGSLRDLVDDDLEDELARAVEARGIPMAVADRMQPWLVATTISLPICELKRKRSGDVVLDAAIAAYGEAGGKPVAGLETVAEQLEAMASLPMGYHVSALEETLSSGTLALDMIQTLKEVYLEGDIGVVFPLMKAVMPKAGSGEGASQFQEALVEKRNITMAERVQPILNGQSAFVAVGALHLPGETGLVKLLREAGFTVSRLR